MMAWSSEDAGIPSTCVSGEGGATKSLAKVSPTEGLHDVPTAQKEHAQRMGPRSDQGPRAPLQACDIFGIDEQVFWAESRRAQMA